MSVFDKWAWIKRNWTYVIEEAYMLDLVFVGGTALNLAIFNEYRASEDIDLYDTNANSIGTSHEEKMANKLAEKLRKKGFKIKLKDKHTLFIGPNIKIDVFNNGTLYKEIGKKLLKNTEKKDLLVFQTKKQIDELPYEKFIEFRSWIYDWLSGFC